MRVALQTTTNKLKKWTTEKGLKFSPNKTTMMIFIKRRKREEEPLEITLGNHKIPPQKKHPIPRHDTRRQTELGRTHGENKEPKQREH